MKLGMIIDYAGGFAETVELIQEYERNGLELVAVPEAYSFDAVSQLGYIGIGVSDMEKWEDYAQNVLGLELVERGEDGTVYLRMDDNHHRFSLHQDPSDDMFYAGWQCANREEGERCRLRHSGAYGKGPGELMAVQAGHVGQHRVETPGARLPGALEHVVRPPRLGGVPRHRGLQSGAEVHDRLVAEDRLGAG